METNGENTQDILAKMSNLVAECGKAQRKRAVGEGNVSDSDALLAVNQACLITIVVAADFNPGFDITARHGNACLPISRLELRQFGNRRGPTTGGNQKKCRDSRCVENSGSHVACEGLKNPRQ